MAKVNKKKRFFEVDLPLISKATQLQGYEVGDLNKRIITYDLTRLLRGKGVMLQFDVQVKENKIITSPRQYKLMPYFLKRMVRKGTNYVEDSFSTKCEDNQIRIKPFLITRRKVSRAVRKALREKAREELIKYAKNKTTEDIFKDVLKNSLQKPLSLKLKKIYPLSLCEIRILKVENKQEE